MTLQEKKIYHQIHPAQLTTDIVTGFGALFLLWQQELFLGVTVAFIPSTIVSLYIIAKVDLEKYKNSKFGAYLRKNVASKSADWGRFGGFIIMLLGGWVRIWWIAASGFAIILLIWLMGIFVGIVKPQKASK
ncbi:MAG TPA: hypothetical protein VMM58_02755 [Bacteroidota bacterium]|nr:hypothetical protein [Bacteroidota bacterium]